MRKLDGSQCGVIWARPNSFVNDELGDLTTKEDVKALGCFPGGNPPRIKSILDQWSRNGTMQGKILYLGINESGLLI